MPVMVASSRPLDAACGLRLNEPRDRDCRDSARAARMAVLLVGTLDTKGAEVAFARDLLRRGGADVLVLDAGCLGEPAFAADVPREEVYSAGGTTLAAA